MALTKDGGLFGWGYSETGRLGEMGQSTQVPSPQEYIDKSGDKYSSSMLEAVEKMVAEKIRSEDSMPIIWEPSLVREATDLEVSDVSCGLDHSLILFCEYFFSPVFKIWFIVYCLASLWLEINRLLAD
jgi:alpha-tubulin suppressor-like RCC1 family protein